MNQTNTQYNNTNKALGYSPDYDYSSKALGTSTAKSLGGAAGSSSDMGSWIEKAQAWFTWYNGVMNGTVALQNGEAAPTQDDYAQMQQWYSYATGGSSWGNGMDASGGAEAPAQQAVPAGAKIGPNGNIVFNKDSGEFTYTDGVDKPIDVLSPEFTLNVSSVAQVSVEKTKDTRYTPALDVYKVIINDPTSKPSQTTLFVSTDTKLTINTINGKNVTFNGGIENDTLPEDSSSPGSPVFTVGEYSSEGTGSTSGGEGWTGGTTEKVDDTHWVHTSQDPSDVIDFTPSTKVKEAQHHEIFGYANITVPADCTANWDYNEKHQWTLTVKDRDGKVIADYLIHTEMGSTANVNINIESLTIHGQKPTQMKKADGTEVWDLDKNITINGEECISTDWDFGGLNGKIGLGVDVIASANAAYPNELVAYADFLGVKPKDLEAALKAAYGDDLDKFNLSKSKKDQLDIWQWLKQSQTDPLKVPNDKLITFLMKGDSTLKGLWDKVKGKSPDQVEDFLKQIQTRLISDLGALGLPAQAKNYDIHNLPFENYTAYGVEIYGMTYNLFPTEKTTFGSRIIPLTPTLENTTIQAAGDGLWA